MIFLGTIANAGSDVKNNANTAVPFTIPAGARSLWLQPAAATHMVAVSATNTGFAPAATDMIQLGAANSIQEIKLPGNMDHLGFTLAIRKTDVGAGTTKVFWS